jgi:hypothetical protein
MHQFRTGSPNGGRPLSTRKAVPVYASCGFAELGPLEVTLAPGIAFPAIPMARRIVPKATTGPV